MNEIDEEYDIRSVMQYSGHSFSANGQPTIIDRSTNQPVPYNTAMTQSDFDQVSHQLNEIHSLTNISF